MRFVSALLTVLALAAPAAARMPAGADAPPPMVAGPGEQTAGVTVPARVLLKPR